MALHITDDFMSLEINETVTATARKRDDGWWEISSWPRLLDRNQAVTALTITELLESGYPGSHPLVAELRKELG
jgi:hypothetical protein